MKKILISLLLLLTILVSVSCNQEKPVLKYEIEITEKLTSVGYQYKSYNREYVSVTHYRFRYHYKTIFPDESMKDGRYEEGDEIKDVSYTAYNKHNVGDKFIADNYIWFSFPN